jgi:hypothetical protein
VHALKKALGILENIEFYTFFSDEICNDQEERYRCLLIDYRLQLLHSLAEAYRNMHQFDE